jgi:hypothetical protein
VLSASTFDPLLRVWERDTGKELLSIRVTSQNYCAAIRPDGKLIAAGGNMGALRVWDAKTGELLHNFRGHTTHVNVIAFARDSRRLVSASADGSVRVWDTETGKESLQLAGHKRDVHSLAVSADGQRALTVSSDSIAKTWDLNTGRELHSVERISLEARGAAFSADGKFGAAVVASRIAIFNAATGEDLSIIDTKGFAVGAIAFHPRGNILATLDFKGVLKLWDIASGKEIASQSAHSKKGRAVAFSPDGTHIVTGSEDSSVAVWKIVHQSSGTAQQPPASAPIADTTRMPDGNFVRPKRAATPQTFLKIASTRGDYVGGGKTYTYGSELNVSGGYNSIVVRVDGWSLNVQPPKNQTLSVGEYRDAKRAAFKGDAAGLDFSGKGRGCSYIHGRFVIWELEVVGGQITRLALDFVQHCEQPTNPPLFGSLRYNSSFSDEPESVTPAPTKMPALPISPPPAPTADEELRQRVHALSRQLDLGIPTGSGRIAENELLRIGAPALPHLREFARSATHPMQKSKVEAVIQKIENAANPPPPASGTASPSRPVPPPNPLGITPEEQRTLQDLLFNRQRQSQSSSNSQQQQQSSQNQSQRQSPPSATDPSPPRTFFPDLGVTASNYSTYGMMVHEVLPNSIATAIKLRSGDIISKINDLPTRTPEEVQKAFAAAADELKQHNKPMRFRVLRGPGLYEPIWRGQ